MLHYKKIYNFILNFTCATFIRQLTYPLIKLKFNVFKNIDALSLGVNYILCYRPIELAANLSPIISVAFKEFILLFVNSVKQI